MPTFSAKPAEMEQNRSWYVLDATNQPLGRLAVEAAKLLRGKNKPEFTPHVDCGDHVIIINADKVRLTGNNKKDEPIYRHTLYPGGIRTVTRGRELERNSVTSVMRVVKGMLPHNTLGAHALKKLRAYPGAEHPHEAQKPRENSLIGKHMATLTRYYGTGHRKNATAKVWLSNGQGEVTVNNKTTHAYFGRITLEALVQQPFEATDTVGKFDVWAKALGGGTSGQAGALRHGISKALIVADPDLRPILRRLGFLTRDPRVKERKKAGRKRARRGFQFSKR